MQCPRCKRLIPRRDKEVTYEEENETVFLTEVHYCSYCNDYFTTLYTSMPICWKRLWDCKRQGRRVIIMLQELVKFRSKYWASMSYSEKVVISMLIEKEKERGS